MSETLQCDYCDGTDLVYELGSDRGRVNRCIECLAIEQGQQQFSLPFDAWLDRDELYAEAAMKWGHDVQWIKAAEEFAELSATLNRALNDQADLEEILDEMADAQIMLEQLQWHLRDEKIDEAVAEKLDRLEGMLDGE